MKVIGITFKDSGKVYWFAPKEGETYEEGAEVIVETSKSVEFAKVAFAPREVDDAEVTQPLKPVLRIATERDREQARRNAERRPQAMKTAQEKIEKHKLDMKLVDCEFAFDGSKAVFYFSAENRVDFRELVKDLAGTFRCRIELRQIGVRDEAKLLGGIAPCGRECCCAGAMPDFRKVSIKMAKVQGLSLNPGKISGLCGRLMCCLSYENDYYSEAYKKMPKLGSAVLTPEGTGTVVSNNMLTFTVRVKIEQDGTLVYKDFPLDEIGKAARPEGQKRADEGEPREGGHGQDGNERGRAPEGERPRREGGRGDRGRRAPRDAERREDRREERREQGGRDRREQRQGRGQGQEQRRAPEDGQNRERRGPRRHKGPRRDENRPAQGGPADKGDGNGE